MPSNIIDSRYHLIHKLGEGLFGEVYLVYDNERYWALKLLKGKLQNLEHDESLAIFKKEFLLLKELRHPGIALIGDFGLDRDLGRYYYTSQYVAGSDFWEASTEMGYLQIEELFVQILRALQYLHQYGIVHGDLKPENILVETGSETRQIKLIDFGVAVFKEPGKIMGSPTYIAPEIFSGAAPTPATDLYAIGVVLYTVLARYNPFRGNELRETVERQKTLVPPAIYKVNPNVPVYIQHILDRLLDKNPSTRYAHAASVIQDLNFISGKNYAIETETSRHSYIPLETKLVGREAEMTCFKRHFDDVFKKGTADTTRLLVISGAPGMGKSRLLSEFKTYAQVNEIPVEVWEEISPVDISTSKLILIPDLLHVPESVLLDALRQAMGKPVLMIGEAREWTAILPATEQLVLSPFTHDETLALLDEVFRGISLTEDFVRTMITYTQGNPLYIQEIVRKLVDEAWRVDPSGRFDEETMAHLVAYLRKTDVPGNLSELLLERLKKLEDLELFTVLALLDRPTPASDLMEVIKDEHLPHRLLELSVQGWVTRSAETGMWSIPNPLLAKQALAKMPGAARADLEEKIGMMLARKDETDPKALYYLSHSLNIDIARQAAEGAYRYYWEREDFAFANQFLDRLLELCGELPLEQILAFKLTKSDCLSALRQFEDAITLLHQCLDEITALSLSEASLKQRMECLKKLGSIYLKIGRLSEAADAYQSGLTLASILKHGVVYKLYFENAKAHVRIQEGQLEAALRIFQGTWSEWQGLPAQEQSEVLNHDLGRTLYLLGRYREAIDQLQQELVCYERAKHFFFEARTHYHLADTYLGLQEWDRAVYHYEAGIEIAKAHRASELLIRLYNGLGNMYQLRQEVDKSIAAYERALRYTRKIQENPAMAGVLTNLGILYHRTGKTHDAFTHLTCSIHLIQQLPSRRAYELHCLARCHLELGDYYIHQGDSKKAEGHLRDAYILCTTHKGIGGLLPWVLERLIRVMLTLSPHSEEFADLFLLWEKAEPNVKGDEKGAYNQLYQDWLESHSLKSPKRPGLSQKTGDTITQNYDDMTVTTYTRDLQTVENFHEDRVAPQPLDVASTVSERVSGEVLSWQAFETAYIAQTLFNDRFNISKVAKSLKLTRATLYRKIHLYRLEELSPLSFSINVALNVPLGLSLKKALFTYLFSIIHTGKVDPKRLTQVLGVSRNRVDRLLGAGKVNGWDAVPNESHQI